MASLADLLKQKSGGVTPAQAEGGTPSIGGLGSGLGSAVGTLIGGPLGGAVGGGIGAIGGNLLTAIPTFIKSDYEKENKKRLEDLKRRQELGTLGFTEQEKQALYNAGSSAIEKAGQDVRDLQSGTAASLATGAGLAAARQVAEQEPIIAARAQLERDLQAKNLEEARAQTQELEERMAIASEAKARRQAAVVGIAAGAVGSADEILDQAKTLRGAKPSSEQLTQFMSVTGLDKKQAAKALGFMARATPEQQALLQSLYTPGSTGMASDVSEFPVKPEKPNRKNK
jgi:hypothetical protein